VAAAAAPSGRVELRGAHISHDLRALTRGRLGSSKTLIGFVVGFAAIIGIGVAVVALAAPSTKPLCHPYRPCGVPPKLTKPLVNETVWRSPEFGYTLEYPGSELSISQRFPDGLTLSGTLGNGDSIAIIIRANPAGKASPSQSVTNLLSSLNGVTQIATDPDPADAILGGGVGHRAGAGGAYIGSIASPQGVSQDAGLASEAASDGHVTISMVAVGNFSDTGAQSLLYALADSVVNSIQWPGSA
jgi:hypothetical protein